MAAFPTADCAPQRLSLASANRAGRPVEWERWLPGLVCDALGEVDDLPAVLEVTALETATSVDWGEDIPNNASTLAKAIKRSSGSS